MNDLVSVIMSTYNSEATVSVAIESILEQSYSNLEFLIVDDASNDNTVKIIEEYCKNSKNIRLFKNDVNVGLTKNLNFLINQSKGEFIARQDDDDYSLPDRLNVQVQTIKKNNLDFCSTRALVIDTNKKIPNFSMYLPKRFVLKFKNPFVHGTLCIQKKSLLNIGCYDEKFYFAQDYKLMKEMVDNKYKFKYLHKPYYFLNMKNNISTKYFDRQQYYAQCVKKSIIPEDK